MSCISVSTYRPYHRPNMGGESSRAEYEIAEVIQSMYEITEVIQSRVSTALDDFFHRFGN